MKKLVDNRTKSSRGNYNECNFSIVSHKTGGYRLRFSKKATEMLDLDEKSHVEINVDENKVIFTNNKSESSFYISYSKSRAIIYSKDLVINFTEFYDLDFSNRSSITFDDSEFNEETQELIFRIKKDQ